MYIGVYCQLTQRCINLKHPFFVLRDGNPVPFFMHFQIRTCVNNVPARFKNERTLLFKWSPTNKRYQPDWPTTAAVFINSLTSQNCDRNEHAVFDKFTADTFKDYIKNNGLQNILRIKFLPVTEYEKVKWRPITWKNAKMEAIDNESGHKRYVEYVNSLEEDEKKEPKMKPGKKGRKFLKKTARSYNIFMYRVRNPVVEIQNSVDQMNGSLEEKDAERSRRINLCKAFMEKYKCDWSALYDTIWSSHKDIAVEWDIYSYVAPIAQECQDTEMKVNDEVDDEDDSDDDDDEDENDDDDVNDDVDVSRCI